MKSKVEKHSARGKTVRLIRLGQRRVEYLLTGLSDELQQKLCEVLNQTSYTDGESKLTDQGRLICQLKPTDELDFEGVIEKTVNLIVERTIHHEGKASKRSKKSGRQSNKSARGSGSSRALAT